MGGGLLPGPGSSEVAAAGGEDGFVFWCRAYVVPK